MLTDLAIRNAKPQRKAYKRADSGGMYLLIKPNGGRYWRLDYRFAGRRRTLALGVYPAISLADARERRDVVKAELAEGVCPARERKIRKLTGGGRGQNTFRAIADEVLERLAKEGRAAVTIAKTRWLFAFANPLIGDRPVDQIKPVEVLAVLRAVEKRGRHETARRLRSRCSMVFRLAVATGRAEHDPTQDLRGALITPRTIHRPAIVEPAAVAGLLRAIDGYTGYPTTRAALQFLALTFVRPGELRTAEWSEFDLNAAVWTIPAAKMKMRRPHRVPLSRQSLAILQTLHCETGDRRYVFSSGAWGPRPMSENTLNGALRRLGYAKDQATAHGFRSMAAVRLNEMSRWNPDAIERQLAHQETNNIRRAYIQAAEFWSERVTMMQAWADYLDELRRGAEPAAHFEA